MRKIALILAMLALPARAEPDKPRTFSELYPPMPGVEYFCEDANGVRFELGQQICITASCQTWTAICDMSLNSPTWRKTQDGCVSASASVLDRLRAAG